MKREQYFPVKFFRFLFLLPLILLMIQPLYATHNRAGEITYRHISNLLYEITVTTYTKESSTTADRCTIEINFGDGSAKQTIERTNGVSCYDSSSPAYCPSCQACDHCGEVFSTTTDIKKNVYKVEHIFPGPGIYTVWVDDQNRNKDVINIPNSVNTSFYIESNIYISPFGGSNSSPILDFPPIDIACSNVLFEHNPGANDPDGDSLVFSIVPNRGAGGAQIPNYSFPNNVPNCASTNLTINAGNGLLSWNYPVCCSSSGADEQEFNIAILIEEYRNGNKIGSILRDMQIEVDCECDNDPPVIMAPSQMCVYAGDTIDTLIVAIDSGYSNPNANNTVTLTASGEPLTLSNNPAQFSQPVIGDSIVSSLFYWKTNCGHLRSNPYIMNFRAEDNDQIQLVDYHSLAIKIIAPKVENPIATPSGNDIVLSWDAALCPPQGYKIYRRIDSSGFTVSDCHTGLPGGSGYSLIADCNTVTANSFTDNNNGGGLIHGQRYCYVVVACYPGGAENMVSEEFCAELKNDIPIITNVSVFITHNSTGKDSIMWAKPKDLDTVQYLPPYQYRVYRSEGFNSASTFIGATTASNLLSLTDTFYVDTDLNTESSAKTYKVELISKGTSVGFTTNASSVFLSSTASDNSLNLSWQELVPWQNTEYYLYKKSAAGTFDYLATSNSKSYTDTGLINGEQYCYYVQSKGSYSSPGIIDTILNNSQIHCNQPFDNVEPCSPDTLQVQADCNEFQNTLVWTRPVFTCADDVTGYKIYYSPLFGNDLEMIEQINSSTDTVFLNSNLISIAGCYAVSAYDTNLNESVLSDTICVDNCPVYELPDVFTPGGDGVNDFFKPFPYKFVAKVNMQIFNRWGQMVYETSDPAIAWDGRHMNTKKMCPAGVYYYVCQVHEVHLTGIETKILKGYFHLIPEDGSEIQAQ